MEITVRNGGSEDFRRVPLERTQKYAQGETTRDAARSPEADERRSCEYNHLSCYGTYFRSMNPALCH